MSVPSQSAGDPQRPVWKVVSASDGESHPLPSDLSPGMTLRPFFVNYVLIEHLVGASPKTVKEYFTTIGYWEQFAGDPPLERSNAAAIGRFRQGLTTLPGRKSGERMAANTQRKHCVNLQFILDRAGPKLRRDQETAKLVADVPYVKRPGLVIHEVRDDFSLAEIGWFLDACSASRAPHGLAVGMACFWRCLGVFAYNVGARPQTLLGLRFSWLVEDEYGWWLSVPKEFSKTKRGLMLYVNSHARGVMERMRAAGDERIFPWPHEEGWLHAERRRILAASLIPEHRRLGFKGFRKACGTQLADINPMAAQLQLGHGGRNVTRDFYVNRKIVAKACEQLPQPKWCEDFGQRQLTLF
jgi:integrase